MQSLTKQFQPYCKLDYYILPTNSAYSLFIPPPRTVYNNISNIQHPVQSGFYTMVNPPSLPTYTDSVQKPLIENILENCFYILSPIIFLTINLSFSESSCNPITAKHESVPGVHSLYS